LIISAAFPPIKSGGSDYAMRLADLMAVRGLDVHVLTSTKAGLANGTYAVLPQIQKWDWTELSKCCAAIKQINPDIIDIHFTGWIFNDHPMITFLPSFIHRILPSAHVSVHIETLSGVIRERSTTLDAAVRYIVSLAMGREGINYEYGSLIRDCDSLILLNERDRKELCKTFPDAEKKCSVMPPPPIMRVASGVDAVTRRRLEEKYGLAEHELTLAFYGYIYPGKGVETLFASLKQLLNSGRKVNLLLIGDVPEQSALDRAGRSKYLADIRSVAKQLGVDSAVRWVGYSDSQSELPSQLLQLSDMCVMPFDSGVMLNNSSFSFVAMHGLPIITTQTKNTEDVFINRVNALLVNPEQPEELANAILEVGADHQLKAQLSDGARALATSVFNWDKTVQKTLALWGTPGSG